MFISLILGSTTTLLELIFFVLIKSLSPQFIQTSMFLYLTFLQLIVIVSVRNQDLFWRGKRPSWLLGLAIALAFVVSLALPYLTIFETWFHFTPLTLEVLAIILGLVVVYLFLLDTIKVWYYRIVERAERKTAG